MIERKFSAVIAGYYSEDAYNCVVVGIDHAGAERRGDNLPISVCENGEVIRRFNELELLRAIAFARDTFKANGWDVPKKVEQIARVMECRRGTRIDFLEDFGKAMYEAGYRDGDRITVTVTPDPEGDYRRNG